MVQLVKYDGRSAEFLVQHRLGPNPSIQDRGSFLVRHQMAVQGRFEQRTLPLNASRFLHSTMANPKDHSPDQLFGCWMVGEFVRFTFRSNPPTHQFTISICALFALSNTDRNSDMMSIEQGENWFDCSIELSALVAIVPSKTRTASSCAYKSTMPL